MRVETLKDLCDYLYADYAEPRRPRQAGQLRHPVELALKRTLASLSRRIYKDTDAGCPIDWNVETQTFTVYPYCEGFDGDLSDHAQSVTLPCESEEIGVAIDAAEKVSREVWDATHGCEKCHTSDCLVEETQEGWRISWDDGESWWTQKEKVEGVEVDSVQYRKEEWEVRMDLSHSMNEWNEESYGVVPINPECGGCRGQGIVM